MSAAALALVLGAVVAVILVRRHRRRTVYIQMSDRWRREHAADPVPEHLR